MKKLVFLLFLVVNYLSYSQDWYFEKPNYKKIEKNIKKKKSNLHYKSLINRFLQADSTMTLKEKRHLYYGYSFHKKYSPYSRSDYGDSLKIILQKEKIDSLDAKKVVNYTDKMLIENPFDLRAINFQLYALEQMNSKKTLAKRIIQMRTLVDALLSSGNGKSKKEAFYVIYTSHEYDLLNILGFQFGGSQSLIDNFDYLTLVENESKIEGLYFDISPCLKSMHSMFQKL